MAKKYSPAAYQRRKARKAADASKQERLQAAFEQIMADMVVVDGSGFYENMPVGVAAMLDREGLNGDSLFQAYVDLAGDYDKPTVLSDAEFDAYVSANGLSDQVAYRGVKDIQGLSGQEMHDISLYGDKYFVGRGIYGDGLYFAKSREVAQRYAERGAYREGAILKGVLKPSAKKIDQYELEVMLRSEHEGTNYFVDDGVLSAYGRSKGYDAITVETSGYINVINRGALVASSKYIDWH